MDAQFIAIIQKLTAERGKDTLFSAALCKALLADYTKGEYTKESRLLLQAVEAGAAKNLAETAEMANCKMLMVKKLQDDHFLSEGAAADVVDMLALVLRGDVSTAVTADEDEWEPATVVPAPQTPAAPAQIAVPVTPPQMAPAINGAGVQTPPSVPPAAQVPVPPMNTSLLSIIKRITAEQGEGILADPQRLKALFKEYARNEPKDQCLAFGRCIELGCYGELKQTRTLEERGQAKARLAAEVQRRSELDLRLCTGALDLLEAVMFGTAPSPDQNSGEFVNVEGGTFFMGSDNATEHEKPVHIVTVSSFYMGKYEVTQQEWQAIMGTTVQQQWGIYLKDYPFMPNPNEAGNYPMYLVSWYEAIEYCNRRSIKEGLTPAYQGSGDAIVCDFKANGYRLPTEAEWEYAAKGGNKDGLCYEYPGSNNFDSVAWHDGNIHPVGTKDPNSLGIYDMCGNVFEMCWDWYWDYSSAPQTDPAGPSAKPVYLIPSGHRVARGLARTEDAKYMRSVTRSMYNPEDGRGDGGRLGFRLVRSCSVRTESTPSQAARLAPVELVLIRGGTFKMGFSFWEPADKIVKEKGLPQHNVTVSSFYLGKYEVTQKEWLEVMGTNPSTFKGDNLPVENVNWFGAVEYCNERSLKEGLTPAYTPVYTIKDKVGRHEVTWNRNANGYRLPTEAEWEYACRAGTTTPFSTGKDISTDQANYNGEKTTPMGSFAPNPWGLYDMHGNVCEWCWDWWGVYSSGAQIDPSGPSSGSDRIVRSGSWSYKRQSLCSAYRSTGSPALRNAGIGFRLARNAD